MKHCKSIYYRWNKIAKVLFKILIKNLSSKERKHKVHTRWYKGQKAKEFDKVEIANLKRNIDALHSKNL